MASLIFRVDGHEVARRRLDRPLVIGRSTACDFSIRDPLLSRQHCRIDFDGKHWLVTDLQSRNGTWFNHQRIQTRRLLDGDEVRIGIVRLGFAATTKERARPRRKRSLTRNRRAAEPQRSLALPGHSTQTVNQVMREDGTPRPSPLPRPRDPVSYSRENLYGLFARIAASSSDSQSHLPIRSAYQSCPMPRPRARGRSLHPPTPRGEPNRYPLRTVSVVARLMLLAYFVIAFGCSPLK